MKTGKALGPDQINSQVLKQIASEIAGPLHHLFHFCISNGWVPRSWKEANIYALHTKSDPRDVEN